MKMFTPLLLCALVVLAQGTHLKKQEYWSDDKQDGKHNDDSGSQQPRDIVIQQENYNQPEVQKTNVEHSEPKHDYSPPTYEYSEPSYEYSKSTEHKPKKKSHFCHSRSSRPKVVTIKQENVNQPKIEETNVEFSKPKTGALKFPGVNEPVNEDSEPEYKYSEPEYKYSEPEYKYPEPEYKYSKPEYKYSEPEYKYSKPEYKHSEPEYKYSEPKYKHSVPEYKYLKPTYNLSTRKERKPKSWDDYSDPIEELLIAIEKFSKQVLRTDAKSYNNISISLPPWDGISDKHSC